MTPTIIEAMERPEWFGPLFPGDGWGGWKAFLAALYALPFPEGGEDFYRACTGRTKPPAEAFAEAALIVGRRGGKSRILGLLAVYAALFRDYRPFLAAGEVGTFAVISADRDQARSVMNYVTGLIDQVPALAAQVVEQKADAITFNCRTAIEVRTASYRTTRGYTFIGVVADEVAFWRTDTDAAVPDTEVIAAVEPAMGTIPGALLLLSSSPYAKAGALYDRFQRHHGRDDAPVLVWQAATRVMNPGFPQHVIDRMQAADPERAASEYGGEFRNDVSAFVDRGVVEDCVVRGRWEEMPLPGVRYSAFVDPSGGASDSMTLAIAHPRDGVAVLDAIREIRPPFSPEAAVNEFAALLQTYHIGSVTGDRYAGEWAREPFRKAGLTYVISEHPKSDIYRDTLPLLNSRKVELLDNDRLVAQMCSLERRVARGGRDSIDHARGAHDDVANAVAGVLLMVGSRKGPLIIPDWALEDTKRRLPGVTPLRSPGLGPAFFDTHRRF